MERERGEINIDERDTSIHCLPHIWVTSWSGLWSNLQPRYVTLTRNQTRDPLVLVVPTTNQHQPVLTQSLFFFHMLMVSSQTGRKLCLGTEAYLGMYVVLFERRQSWNETQENMCLEESWPRCCLLQRIEEQGHVSGSSLPGPGCCWVRVSCLFSHIFYFSLLGSHANGDISKLVTMVT